MSGKLSIGEVEKLSYYDFMGYMGVPFFNFGGVASIDRLAEICGIEDEVRVLEVGSGTGTNACYLAKRYGCTVVGIDISEEMVRQATRRAEEQGLSDKVSFTVGDAYDLRFPDGSFDIVITVFVSQFLDPSKAFPEFGRVLMDGGRLGINEMYRADDVPMEAREHIDNSVKEFCKLTELPFTLRSPTAWGDAFKLAGFADVTVEANPNYTHKPYAMNMVDEFGGWRKLMGTLWSILVYYLRSGTMRRHFTTLSRVKKTLLRDDETSKYVGYALCSGKKA